MTQLELANLFLERYRVLEDKLSDRFIGDGKRHNSVVYDFANSDEGAIFADDLNMCREIRNLLSHNPTMNGTPIVTPAPELIDILDGVIEYIDHPLRLKDIATPLKNILTANMHDNLMNTMHAMHKRGFSHVPILDHGIIVGVLSRESIFTYVTTTGNNITSSMRIDALKKTVPIDKHASERFMFCTPDESVLSVLPEFSRFKRNNKRLSLIFLTKSGKTDEPLEGLASPWDLLSSVNGSLVAKVSELNKVVKPKV